MSLTYAPSKRKPRPATATWLKSLLTYNPAPTGERVGQGRAAPRNGRPAHSSRVVAEYGPPPTVLVVDDQPEQRSEIRRHLQSFYRVLEASNGLEALEIVGRRAPDFILCDSAMPGLDGLALLKRLRANSAFELVPVILLAEEDSRDERLEALLDGADDYLLKPCEPRELRVRIHNILAIRRRLLGRAAPSSAPTLDGPADVDVKSSGQAFLERVLKVIGDRLGDSELTVEEVASRVGCDRSHLLRRLRAVSDQTPSALIRSLRLQKAADLLRADAGRVSEIAYSVGFKSLPHFSNTFAKAYGERPSSFAARHRS